MNKGSFYTTAEGYSVRVFVAPKQRAAFAMSSCRSDREAAERSAVVGEIAHRFRRASMGATSDAIRIMEGAAACAPALLQSWITVAEKLVGGRLRDKNASTVPTFKALADDWTTGKLAERHPDHVKAKDSELDASRLKMLCAIDVGGTTLGAIPLDAFRLDHAETAMRNLPERARRPGTRRHYAQLINRVLALAVYPCRIIGTSPLPKGFMPKVGKSPAFPFLYPDEEAALMACEQVPLGFRMLWGFLAREGCRVSEALGLTFRDVDLERGAVGLDKNKTDDPRTWALGPDVAEALRRWREARSAEPAELLFPEASAENGDKLAEVLRAHLVTAKVERAELHHAGTNRRPMRVHDLRGTFVTLSLANGRTETWVADRTGHKSSQMINRYRRQSRTASELGLGWLVPMGDALENDPSTIHQTGSEAMVMKSSSNETSRIPAVAPPGIEPGRPFGQRILSPPRLPFRQGAVAGVTGF